jgi:hypothetical protein
MAIERLLSAEDQNLLDGFMMALQVYPDQLEYQKGFQHLEILFRPIPRSLWPGKPLGGYANKLGLNDKDSGLTVGISESLYGTFYGEYGLAGIIGFSILYGFLFALFVYRAERYESDFHLVLKGVAVASLLVLIRGGDLAGIVAFIGMSYWPLIIVNYQYGKFIKRFNRWFNDAMAAKQLARLQNTQNQETKALAESATSA